VGPSGGALPLSDQILLRRLSAISAAIAEGLPREAVFERIVESIQQMGFDRIRLSLLSPDGGLIDSVAAQGFEEDGLGGPVPTQEDSDMERLLADPRPQLLSCKCSELDVSPGPRGCVPVLLKGRVVGKICVERTPSHGWLDEEHLQGVLDLAHQVALVLLRDGATSNGQEGAEDLGRATAPEGATEPEIRWPVDQEASARIYFSLLERDAKRLERLDKLVRATQEMMDNLDAISLPDRLTMIARHAADILEAETSGVFRAHKGHLVLEASFGHLPEFNPVNVPPLEIHDKLGGGLTGYIAYHRELFNEHAEKLENHKAVAKSNTHSPLRTCYSLLAIPLLKRVGHKEELIGLLRADNKKGENGKNLAPLGFTQEDERILKIFAKAAVIAIESAELVEFREKLISSSPHGIIAVDREGKITEFNKRAEEVLGYTRAEILDKSVDLLYVTPGEPHIIGQMLRAAQDGYVRDYETEIRSETGERIPILHSSTWLRDANGRRVGSVGYFEDLRLRKALEHRESLLLRASNTLAQAEALNVGLQHLVEMIVSELGRSFCGILLLDEEGESLTLRAECLGGDPDWKSERQKFILAEWGLKGLLEAGKPFIRERKDERYRPILGLLTNLRGFAHSIETLLVVPLKIGDRVVGQLDLGDLEGVGRPGFSREEQELVSALAAQVTILIDRFQLLESKGKREELLEALVEASRHVRAEVEMPVLHQVIVRLAAELARCRMGGLLLNRPHMGQLELAAVYGMPEDLIGRTMSHEDGFLGKVARQGNVEVVQNPRPEDIFYDPGLRIVAAVPFRAASGQVEAVLFLGDSVEKELFGPTDLGILRAFATQATIALSTARLMGREQLYLSQLATLHSISDYIQEVDSQDKIFHPVLTGVTASYGLGFNRAVLMLVDNLGEQLVGELGIGEIEEAKARTAWKADNATNCNDFAAYLQRLKQGEIPLTTVGMRARGLCLPIGGADFFSKVVEAGKLQRVKVEELDRIPALFRETFEISTQLGVAPLVAKNQVIGILVVDNKFTRAPIGDESCDALMTFASTAAVAIHNKRLLDQTRAAKEAAEVVARVTLLEDRRNILETIAGEIRATLRGDVVVLYKYDQDTGELVLPPAMDGKLYPSDQAPDYSLVHAMLAQPESYIVTDPSNDELFKKSPFRSAQQIKACVAIPLKAAGRTVGVMFINYRSSHRFGDEELALMEMFANQSAVAIRNDQLFMERTTKLAQQEAVARLSRELLGAKTVQEAMNRAVEQAARALNTELCNIVLPNEEGRLIFGAGFGWQRELIGKFEVGPGMGSQTGYTIATRRPILVDDFRDVPFEVPNIVFGQSIRAGLSVPMFRGDEVIGAMLVHTRRRRRRFTGDDVTLLSLIANQTATALERVRQYEESQRKSAYLGALYEASKAITAHFGLERRQILDLVVRFAMQGIESVQGPKPVLATIHLYDEDRDELVLEGVFPSEAYDNLVQRLGKRRSLRARERRGERIGVIGRTVLTSNPILVEDIRKNRDYISCSANTRSELAVPLLDRGQTIGVLNFESDEVGAFDEGDCGALQGLAELVVVAIQKARQFEELKEANLLVNSRTTLAWMGIGNAVRSHEMAGYVGAIRSDLLLLTKELKKLRIGDDGIRRILERVGRMARAAGKMNKSLSGRVDARRKPILVNGELIRSWSRYFQKERSKRIEPPVRVELRCELPDTAAVLANVFWLKQVLDILVNNSIDATKDLPTRTIVLGSHRRGPRAEVYVSDDGPGISEKIRHKIFHEPIEKQRGAKGLGMGLLVAQAVVQIYGGNMALDERAGRGATVVISLPLER